MQVLAHNPEIETFTDSSGEYIKGFLIGTKFNEANWKINKTTGHDLIKRFEGTDFAIIPELINTPLSKGGGGHYFGQDTLEDLKKGYGENSHGKYHKILGPYSYNDGTDDYFYNAIIKLNNSKAASELVKHGAETWVPYSISPHIWPKAGPDNDIYDWEPIGGALVIKGAYGPQAVISKLCKGTAAQCEKSLGASNIDKILERGYAYKPISNTEEFNILTKLKPCEQKDTELAEIISSLVSKSANSPHTMPETKDSTAPVITNLTAEVVKPNATVNSQEAITNGQLTTRIPTPEELALERKEKEELKKQVTELSDWKRMTTASLMFGKVKDEKQKEELVKKYSKYENIDQLKEFLEEVLPILKASEQEEPEPEKPEEGDKQKTGGKGKAASLPKEPELPKEEQESKAASIPVNKLQEIMKWKLSGGRA